MCCHHVPGLIYYTLALVVLILAAGIVASVLIVKHKEKRHGATRP